MYLSVMNALIKLIASRGRVRFPEKVVTDVPAHVLGFFRGQFFPGH